jgi:type VI secretion system protein ImpH
MKLSRSSPLERIIKTPEKFDFFQVVRVLEHWAIAQSSATEFIGNTQNPSKEAIRFTALPALRFPISSISKIEHKIKQANLTPFKIETTFAGLVGANGLLPHHYTELIIKRLQVKDSALIDFLNLFNHRIISLFYKSWEKNHFYIGYERAHIKHTKQDPFSYALMCLIGNGTDHLQNRSIIADETLLFYAGYFAKQIRSAASLKNLLMDYLQVTVDVQQFQPKLLIITPDSCTAIAHAQYAVSHYNQLGINSVLGRRAWDAQHHFRLRIGPLSLQQFNKFLPNEIALITLVALTRRYIGIALTFDVQLILSAPEVPACQLSKGHTVRLGWNTWLKTRPFINDADATILPIREAFTTA